MEVRRVFSAEGFADPVWTAMASQPPAESKWAKFFQGLAMASTYNDPGNLVGLYLDAVDWTSSAQTLAALRAIEELLWLFDRDDELNDTGDSLPGDRLQRQLEKDGFRVDERGRIHPAPQLFLAGSLTSLRDPSLIRQVLQRINRALPDDPMLAIGSAKELVEATSMVVLLQLGEPVPKADLPRLVFLATKALGVHPGDVDTQSEEGRLVRQLLGRLTSITDDLAALRNAFGTGHAHATLPKLLKANHGRLAVATADAWCTFMLDELADRQSAGPTATCRLPVPRYVGSWMADTEYTDGVVPHGTEVDRPTARRP